MAKVMYGNVVVGEVITNQSLTVEQALDLINFDEESFLAEQGWDAVDYNDFTLDYSAK